MASYSGSSKNCGGNSKSYSDINSTFFKLKKKKKSLVSFQVFTQHMEVEKNTRLSLSLSPKNKLYCIDLQLIILYYNKFILNNLEN